MYYSLFVYCFYYKIMFFFSKFSGPWACELQAYPSLAHWYGPGLGQTLRVWAKILVCWPGLDTFLQAWILTANCEPGLGSNFRPVQGTNTYASSVAQKFGAHLVTRRFWV